MPEFVRSVALLLALLNPFLLILYLLDAVQSLGRRTFRNVLFRAALIAAVVFSCFTITGDVIFSDLFQAEFASFQIFGGIIFLLVGLQFFFRGHNAIEILRGESEHLVGAIAMPVLIGPGTLSASVVVGKRLDPIVACAAIFAALGICISAIILLKMLHDYVRSTNEGLVQRYIEIAGRVTALYVGTVSIEMIMQGVRSWVQKF